ncbi:MAG TPA: NfeD family protein [Thermoplasmata archaeon]|nr:NfeD family protein [Thermoplasmata archaeon]
MSPIDPTIGIALVIVGIFLLAFELVHPGALLLIPGSILLVAGFLYLFLPNVLLDSYIGPVGIIVVAIVAALIEIPYYRWVAPTHRPLSTTSGGLVGDEAIVIVPIVPNTLKGKVRVRSEVWSARAAVPIAEGTRVRIIHGEGVSVTVEPLEPPKVAGPST